jgi:hypothetical protein
MQFKITHKKLTLATNYLALLIPTFNRFLSSAQTLNEIITIYYLSESCYHKSRKDWAFEAIFSICDKFWGNV